MRLFTKLYTDLDATTKTNAKVDAMVSYFQNADELSATWAVALLTGRRPKRPAKSTLVRQWALELSGIPSWLFEECYGVVGDLSETIALLTPAGNKASEETLHELMQKIISLGERSDEEKKEWLLDMWKHLPADETFIFNKLIGGSFRVGVSQQLVFKALAKVYGTDEKKIAHRLMGKWDPSEKTITEMLAEDPAADHSLPYPFYLAYQLDAKPESLGNIGDWLIERKYDGIRGQLISRGGEIHVWSRGEELMTEKFIEFASLKDILPDGIVLDGEVLPFKAGKILSFNEMQKRIGRKNLSRKMLDDVPLCLMCYDLLEWEGKDIREWPLRERRKQLEALLSNQPTSLLKISPLVSCSAWEQLDDERQASRQLGCEGLMLKRADSIYETGRKRGSWWKWKIDPYTIDAVLIYAQPGHGRRANLYTDYTFAVRDNEQLVPFAKAYSGLTDKEIIEVDQWIKKNTLEKFGPVRSVKAELVFEIAFEGIQRSPRHKSGIALRFPRIARWRKDKKTSEINTRSDLMQLLEAV